MPHGRRQTYFRACSEGTATDIALHFTQDVAIFDTNVRAIYGAMQIGEMWVKVRERWGGAWTFDPTQLDTGLIGFDYGVDSTD